MQLNYRKSVGAFLINEHKQVFIANRLNLDNAWQLPQGGMEDNENPKEAILRELLEEIGSNNADVLTHTPPYRYQYPNNIDISHLKHPYIGQEIIWFALLFKGKNTDINLNFSNDPEFSMWRWENPCNIINLIVDFKKAMYLKLLNYMKLHKVI